MVDIYEYLNCYSLYSGVKNPTRHPGAFGSILDLKCHSVEPIFASVGLDRYLRLYSTRYYALEYKVCDICSCKLA